eukprot:TRINITY_DN5395_c0_g1_i1.p1 TRINITY_DN5395_c0_g1~~TRINITY_DN5395_c0_g1_i1.p1  ORF type:complete len:348 (-),score=68.35 TRINITY_DN5395_c0_g1_i1:110-1069(-)
MLQLECIDSPRSSNLIRTEPATPCRQPRPVTTPPGFCKQRQRRSTGLLKAVMKDDLEAVRSALEEDPLSALLPLSCGSPSESPLCVAMKFGASIELVELLLAYGADPNQCDITGNPPLLMVAMSRPIFGNDATRHRADTWSSAQLNSASSPTTCISMTSNAANRPRAETCPLAALKNFDPFSGLLGAGGQLSLLPPPPPPHLVSATASKQVGGGYSKLSDPPLPCIAENFSASLCFLPLPPLPGLEEDEKEEALPKSCDVEEQRCRMTEERCFALAEMLIKYHADVYYQDAEGLTAIDHAVRNGRERLADLLTEAQQTH